MWYVIDSHARDSAGMIVDQDSSVVLQLPNYMTPLHYIRCFMEHATSQRVINQNDLASEATTLQVRERKPVRSDEHLILPIKSLLTYRTCLGGIDIYSILLPAVLRNTPTEGLGTSPVQWLMGRQTRTLLPTQTILDGIPSKNGDVMFIGIASMMARKCMINWGTVTPNACLSWPDFLALPL